MAIFCRRCGSPAVREIPIGDNRERDLCHGCGHIEYDNPRVITGALVRQGNQLLLAKRNIEPRKGFWTLPAGFMENGETIGEGALRETFEETLATPKITTLHSVHSIPHISQVYMFYNAVLEGEHFGATPESIEVKLFAHTDIPWQTLAFPVIYETLQQYTKQWQANPAPEEWPTLERVIDRRH